MKNKQITWLGARPRTANQLLNINEAQIAENCKLNKGDLRPWRDLLFIKTTSGSSGLPKTLYRYDNGDNSDDNVWICVPDEYDFCRSPSALDAQSRVYYTGASEPRAIAKDLISDPFNFSTDYYKLGVPAPTAKLTIDSGYSTDNIYRAYVYSYVVRIDGTDYEEGPPSSFDAIEDYGSGDVTLSGFTAPPSGREIGTIRIYRTNEATSGVSAFQYVGEFQTAGVNFTTKTFTDDVAEEDLGTDGPVPETYIPPPEGMKGLTSIGSSFMGFVDNVIYISEPNLPHAWPYTIPVDATIIGLSWFGSTGVVLTDSHVYLLMGSPEAMVPMKLDGIYPCRSKRGIVSNIGREGGVMFPSEEGWCIVSQNGVTDISKSVIDPTTWRDDFYPETTHAYYYEEKLFAFFTNDDDERSGYIVDFQNELFTTLTTIPSAAHREIGSGKFYFVNSTETIGIPDWQFAFTLFIDKDKFDEDRTNFVVDIILDSRYSEMFTELEENKLKMSIHAYDESLALVECKVEVELWDDTEETGVLHVKVPFISSTADTELYLAFDATRDNNTDYVAAVTGTAAKQAWPSEYEGVWHWTDDPSTSSIIESTTNGDYGTVFGSMTSDDLVDGLIGNAVSFDGVDDYIRFPDGTSSDFDTDDFTFEFVINRTATGTKHYLASKRQPQLGAPTRGFEVYITADDKFKFYMQDSDGGYISIETADTIVEGQNYLVLTMDRDGMGTLYVNGVADGEADISAVNASLTGSEPTTIGANWDQSSGFFEGDICVTRFARIHRSAAWVKATYNSLMDTLISVGTAYDAEGVSSYNNSISRWEGADADNVIEFTWKSKKHHLPWPTNFSAARLLMDTDGGDSIEFKLFGDDTLIHTETVSDEKPFRLPSSIMYKQYEYQVKGSTPVKEVTVATSMDEIEAIE